jgi:hypothetical protein
VPRTLHPCPLSVFLTEWGSHPQAGCLPATIMARNSHRSSGNYCLHRLCCLDNILQGRLPGVQEEERRVSALAGEQVRTVRCYWAVGVG